MTKAITLFLAITILAIISLPLCRVTSARAANSVTYTVGTWQITLTDLGLLPGGSASRGLAINNLGQITGLATDSSFALQRPIWDSSTGIIIGTADNWDPASTAVPEHRNDNGEMVGTEVIRTGTIFEGVYWNPAGRAFGLPSLPGVDPVFGPVHVKAHCINNHGQIVGGAHDGTSAHPMHAVLWQNKVII